MNKAQRLFTLKAFLTYYQQALGAHGIHSPFVFELWNKVIVPSKKFRFQHIETFKKELRSRKEEISFKDFKNDKLLVETVGSLARASLSSSRFSSFLFHLLRYQKTSTALETGTSLGINSSYMAKGCQNLITIEGNDSIAKLATSNLASLGSTNTVVIKKDVSQGIGDLLTLHQPEVIFLDADHRSSTTRKLIDEIKNCESVHTIVIHDIYWSIDMNNFWNEMVSDDYFSCSIDLFQAGVLFKKDMEKQHFVLKF